MDNTHVPHNHLLNCIFGEDVRVTNCSKAYNELMRQIDTLEDREKAAIELRFFKGYTLEHAAKSVGVTRERIRQWESKALRKLRMPYRIKHIMKYVVDADY